MSVQAMTLVAAIKAQVGKPAGICVAKKAILMAMANYADHEFQLYPSYQTLIDDTFLSRRTIMQHVGEMEQLGLLSRSSRSSNRGTQSNLYQLTIIPWLRGHGYEIVLNDQGFMTAKLIHRSDAAKSYPQAGSGETEERKNAACNEETPPQPSNVEGCEKCQGGVRELPGGGARNAPKPVIDPVKRSKRNTNTHAKPSKKNAADAKPAQPQRTEQPPGSQQGQRQGTGSGGTIRLFSRDLTLTERMKLDARKISADPGVTLESEFDRFRDHYDGACWTERTWQSKWRGWDGNHRFVGSKAATGRTGASRGKSKGNGKAAQFASVKESYLSRFQQQQPQEREINPLPEVPALPEIEIE